jgi:hypothetical protein
MKKLLLTPLALLLVMSVHLNAQTVIFSDGFESYNANALLVQQSGLPWYTWTLPYHAPHDVNVVTTQASQGTKSIQVLFNQDIVLDLGAKTTGRYQVSFDLYVSPGAAAYFNLLQEYAGNNSSWGFQTFFNTNGTGTIDAGGTEVATFNFTHGTWHQVNLIVDVDDDFATYYLNGTELISWKFSKGATGGGTMMKLDGLNFYGYTANNYFVDEVKFIQHLLSQVPAPANFQANYAAGDVTFTWDAPVGATPQSYTIMGNDKVIASGITGTSYTDIGTYPGYYSFSVRAHYTGLGYSHNSNTDTLTVPGGIQRNFVLIEKGTGTWCQYCPGAAMGLRDLHNAVNDVAIIAYHYNDAFQTQDALDRIGYYNITAYPTVVFDGGSIMAGGNATQSLYASYRPVYDEKVAIPAIHTIDVEVTQIGSNDYAAAIEVEQLTAIFSGPFALFGVVTESAIMQNWQNQNRLDHVFRSIHPSSAGMSVNFATTNTFNTTLNFQIPQQWVKNNCEFIVFLQDLTTKRVMHAALIDMSTIIGIEELTLPEVVVRPNPASEFVSVYASGLRKINILSMTGQTVLQSIAEGNETHLLINHLPAGIYLIQIETDAGTATRKLVVK